MPISGLGALAGPAALAVGAGVPWLRRKLLAMQGSRNKAKAGSRTRQAYKGGKTLNVAGRRNLTFVPRSISKGLNRNLTLCYDGGLLTSTTASTYGAEHSWKLNDIYHSNSGAATDQPLYYDQFEAMYHKYRVYAVTVEMRWSTTNTTGITACSIKIKGSEETSTLTGVSPAYVASQPGTNTIRIAPGGEHTFYMPPRTFSIKQLEGEKWITKGDDYQANFGASPAESPKLIIGIANMVDNSQTPAYYSMRLTFHTHLFDSKIPSASTA